MLKRKLQGDLKRQKREEEQEMSDPDVYMSSDSDSDDEAINPNVAARKEKVMMLSSRGISSRFRHFKKDLELLLPHSKKESKLDSKSKLSTITEIMDLSNCTSCLYFETKRQQDHYMWASVGPSGPTLKFQVLNIHTADELKLRGNALKGSRPIISFDSSFDDTPHHKLIKEILSKIFNTPKGHRKSKPFIDHVLTFSIADDRIWFRNYQINEDKSNMSQSNLSLIEIGPRFVMQLLKIFDGCFSGPVIHGANEKYATDRDMN